MQGNPQDRARTRREKAHGHEEIQSRREASAKGSEKKRKVIETGVVTGKNLKW